MVGVFSSNGCTTCRKRKIKCDETWPVCRQCQKSQRHCPGAPTRLKFVDNGKKYRIGPEESCIDLKPDTPDSPSSSKMTVVTARSAKNGALFQKMRLGHSKRSDSPVPIRRPSPSQSDCSFLSWTPSATPPDLLARSLVDAFNTDRAGFRYTRFGTWLNEVPKRIGASRALDDAGACLAEAHQALVAGRDSSTWINPTLYGRALRSLQRALEDKAEWRSSNTLAATGIMYILELSCGSPPNRTHLLHANGISTLLQSLGPAACTNDALTYTLAFEHHGQMTVEALLANKSCFLSHPSWTALFTPSGHQLQQTPVALTPLQSRHTVLLRALVSFPALLRDLRALRACDPLVDPDELLGRAHSINTPLRELGQSLMSDLTSGVSATEAPTTPNLPAAIKLSRTSYRFKDFETARLYVLYWSLRLSLHRLLVLLAGPGSNEAEEAESEIPLCAENIWKSYEDAWSRRPFGALYMFQALGATWTVAASKDKSHTGAHKRRRNPAGRGRDADAAGRDASLSGLQSRLLAAMNALEDYRCMKQGRWNEKTVNRVCLVGGEFEGSFWGQAPDGSGSESECESEPSLTGGSGAGVGEGASGGNGRRLSPYSSTVGMPPRLDPSMFGIDAIQSLGSGLKRDPASVSVSPESGASDADASLASLFFVAADDDADEEGGSLPPMAFYEQLFTPHEVAMTGTEESP